MIFRLIGDYLKKKNERRWREWKGLIINLKRDSSLALAEIVSVRQKARTGTKAYVYWYNNVDQRDAVWIPKIWPNSGDFVLGRGGYGHGKHHKEEVFYFNKVIKIVQGNVYRGFIKHQKRIEKIM